MNKPLTAAQRLLADRKGKRTARDFSDLAFCAREAKRYGLPLGAYVASIARCHPDMGRRVQRLMRRVKGGQR